MTIMTAAIVQSPAGHRCPDNTQPRQRQSHHQSLHHIHQQQQQQLEEQINTAQIDMPRLQTASTSSSSIHTVHCAVAY